jgi:hypothetical protein
MMLEEARAFVTHVHDQVERWPGLYAGNFLKEILGTGKIPCSGDAGSRSLNRVRPQSSQQTGTHGSFGSTQTGDSAQNRTPSMESVPVIATTLTRTRPNAFHYTDPLHAMGAAQPVASMRHFQYLRRQMTLCWSERIPYSRRRELRGRQGDSEQRRK